jgi:hypothetical protein
MTDNEQAIISISHKEIDKTVLENIDDNDIVLDILLLSETKRDIAINIIFDELFHYLPSNYFKNSIRKYNICSYY